MLVHESLDFRATDIFDYYFYFEPGNLLYTTTQDKKSSGLVNNE
jgi:hypothetical protein